MFPQLAYKKHGTEIGWMGVLWCVGGWTLTGQHGHESHTPRKMSKLRSNPAQGGVSVSVLCPHCHLQEYQMLWIVDRENDTLMCFGNSALQCLGLEEATSGHFMLSL